MAQVLSLIDLIERFNRAMSDINLDAAKKLGLTSIKKYQKCTSQVEIELD